jgi:hypothetical protein
MKTIFVVGMGCLLAACGTSLTSPSVQAEGSFAGSASPWVSASTAASETESCEAAFASLDLGELARSPELSAVADALDDTIAQCPTLADWTALVQLNLPEVDLSGIEAFLHERCTDSEALAASPICTEVVH